MLNGVPKMANKKTALISEAMPLKIRELFGFLGYGCVCLPPFEALDAPVASHPDMLFSVLSGGELLTDGRYYEKNKVLLDNVGVSIRVSESRLEKSYPEDIAFDALVFGGRVYGYIKRLAPEILEKSLAPVNVKQGYALCSVLATDKCALTADEGIYRALVSNGADALKISPEGVNLSGYGRGFIGGASAFDPISNTVIFFGDITRHQSYPEIKSFLEKRGYKLLYAENEPLTDYGGAKLLNN